MQLKDRKRRTERNRRGQSQASELEPIRTGSSSRNGCRRFVWSAVACEATVSSIYGSDTPILLRAHSAIRIARNSFLSAGNICHALPRAGNISFETETSTTTTKLVVEWPNDDQSGRGAPGARPCRIDRVAALTIDTLKRIAKLLNR
jgi:hypothetical protein